MSLGKIVAFLGLLVLGFVGLAITVCGGGVIFEGLGVPASGEGLLILLIAISSLAAGLIVLFFVWRVMKQLKE